MSYFFVTYIYGDKNFIIGCISLGPPKEKDATEKEEEEGEEGGKWQSKVGTLWQSIFYQHSSLSLVEIYLYFEVDVEVEPPWQLNKQTSTI